MLYKLFRHDGGKWTNAEETWAENKIHFSSPEELSFYIYIPGVWNKWLATKSVMGYFVNGAMRSHLVLPGSAKTCGVVMGSTTKIRKKRKNMLISSTRKRH